MTEVSIAVDGEPDGALMLKRWLTDDATVRRQVNVRSGDDGGEHLGPGLDLLQAAIAPGGVASVLIVAVFAWLRTRKPTVTVDIRKGDRSAKISAQQVRGLSVDNLNDLAREVSDSLTE